MAAFHYKVSPIGICYQTIPKKLFINEMCGMHPNHNHKNSQEAQAINLW